MTVIYTDGACSGNPGPGGWGVLIIADSGETRELFGGEATTTNNRMEMTAAIEGLNALPAGQTLTVITDSTYVRDGITSWLANWKARGWKTAAKKPVKNIDLWQALDTAAARHDVTWEWVRGHTGDPGNERADTLARQGMAPYQA
jgi:ribonuclease HI